MLENILTCNYCKISIASLRLFIENNWRPQRGGVKAAMSVAIGLQCTGSRDQVSEMSETGLAGEEGAGFLHSKQIGNLFVILLGLE